MNKVSAPSARTLMLLSSLAALGGLGYKLYKYNREEMDPAYKLGNVLTDVAEKESQKLKSMPWPLPQSSPSEFIGQMGRVI